MHLAVLEAARTGAGLQVVSTATQLGHDVTFVTSDPGRYGNEPPAGALDPVRLAVCDTSDPDAVVRALGEGGYRSPDGLACLSDDFVETAAGVAARLGLPFASPAAVSAARHKDVFRGICAAAGIPAPLAATVTSIDDAVRVGAEIGYPCVVKPTFGGGSRGVVLVADEDELRDAYARSGGSPGSPGFLIEEYAKGPLVSLEMLSAHGRATLLGVSDRVLTAPPHFVELAESFPAPVGEEARASLAAFGERVLDALDYRVGPTHIEAVLTPDGPKVIEVNARLAGGAYGAMMCASLKFSVFEAIVEVALGGEPALDTTPVGAGAGASVYPPRAGVVREIRGLDRALGMPGAGGVIARVRPGDHVTPPPRPDGEPVYVWCTGDDVDTAKARTRVAAELIEYVLD